MQKNKTFHFHIYFVDIGIISVLIFFLGNLKIGQNNAKMCQTENIQVDKKD